MVSKDTIEKVAAIARLELTEEEKESFAKDLESILKAFSTLDKAKVKDTKPTFQPIEVKNVVREDKIEPSLSQEEALSNSPNKDKGFFKGPKVV